MAPPIAAVVGELISALALNLFIVPLNLYTGGTMGVCQLVRTLLQTYGGLDFGPYDVAGILYFITNIPILIFAYKNLGRGLVIRTVICTVAYSFFYSIIPTPSAPIVNDYLTACLLGGILTGIGSGIVLTCGCSGRRTGHCGALPEQAGQYLHRGPVLSAVQRCFVLRLPRLVQCGSGDLLHHL